MKRFNQILARQVLEKPCVYHWSWQGFGMLRTYLDEGREFRFHIWNQEDANPGVSTIHDHPWDFESFVVCGELINKRFLLPTERRVGLDIAAQPVQYNGVRIKCGEGGCMVNQSFKQILYPLRDEVYHVGDCYQQYARELHETRSVPGTVTIIRRKFGQDTEHAHVYWLAGEWVSAEPRPATRREVFEYTSAALQMLKAETE